MNNKKSALKISEGEFKKHFTKYVPSGAVASAFDECVNLYRALINSKPLKVIPCFGYDWYKLMNEFETFYIRQEY